MDEQLRYAMAELINLLTKGAEGLYAFGQEQVPEVLTQLLMWKGVSSGLLCLLFFSLFCSSLYLIWRVKNSKPESMWRGRHGDLYEGSIAVFVCAPIAAAVFFGVTLANHDWLQILIAPKLYLLEYAAQLVK